MFSAIVYSSCTGSCKKYSEMISKELSIPAVSIKELPKDVRGKLVYVGWLCAGRIKGYKRISEKFNIGAVVQVGMAPVELETEAQSRKINAVPADTPIFCMQGGLHMKKLPVYYRVLMNAVNKSTVKKLCDRTDLTPQEKATYNMALTGEGEPYEWDVSDVVEWCRAH